MRYFFSLPSLPSIELASGNFSSFHLRFSRESFNRWWSPKTCFHANRATLLSDANLSMARVHGRIRSTRPILALTSFPYPWYQTASWLSFCIVPTLSHFRFDLKFLIDCIVANCHSLSSLFFDQIRGREDRSTKPLSIRSVFQEFTKIWKKKKQIKWRRRIARDISMLLNGSMCL